VPIVTVDMWEGRTVEERRKLAKEITEAFVKIGVPATAVSIVMNDHPKSCWAQGGKLCSDA
jgi:4-oxalocrotonate tautomerase